MTAKTDKAVVTPEVKAETPKVVVKEATVAPVSGELSASTKAEMEAGRKALAAYKQ